MEESNKTITEIERRRLAVEEKRLAVEGRRLYIEEQRLQLEKIKMSIKYPNYHDMQKWQLREGDCFHMNINKDGKLIKQTIRLYKSNSVYEILVPIVNKTLWDFKIQLLYATYYKVECFFVNPISVSFQKKTFNFSL